MYVLTRDAIWEIRFRKMKKKRNHNGLTKHPLYGVWKGMLDRCYNPNSYSFPLYGAREIEVCERWLSLKNFVLDVEGMEGFTLDRIDPNGDYSPKNCRLASRKTQAKNMRVDKRREVAAIHKSIMEEAFGVI